MDKGVIASPESKQMKVVLPKWAWFSIMKKLSETDKSGQQLAELIWFDVKKQEEYAK